MNVLYPAGILVLAIAGMLVFRRKFLYHFKTVVPSILYRSGILGDFGLRYVCRRYKIRTIVNLLNDKESGLYSKQYRAERRYCDQNHIKWFCLPMKTDCPPTVQQIESFLQLTKESRNLPILIHCAQGVVRTNMMVTVFLKHYYDMDNHKIMKILPFFGHRLEKRPRVHDFIKNYSKVTS